MQKIRSEIRKSLRTLSSLLGSEELIRKCYYLYADSFFLKNSAFIKKAWLRRSTITQDFVPFMSDLDVTIVIDHRQATPLSWPLTDIEIISEDFFVLWLEAGGLRNKSIQQWKPFKTEDKFLVSQEVSKEVLAFEIAYEFFLLYKQLILKCSQQVAFTDQSLIKLQLDLLRLKLIWDTQDYSPLYKPRIELLKEVKLYSDLNSFITFIDQFISDLLNELPYELQQYQLGLIDFPIEGKQVYCVRENDDFTKAVNSNPHHFIATESMIRLIKGVGILEHTHLNKLTKDKSSYFYKFNKQRLAQDLLGATLSPHRNDMQIFYCLKNICEFIEFHRGKIPPNWNANEKLGFENFTAVKIVLSQYLDALKTI